LVPDLDFSSIPAPSDKCVVCGRDLALVNKHPSLLNVDDQDRAERRDVCPECWEKMGEGDFFSFWLTQREPPKPDSRITREEQNRRLLALFERICGLGEDRFRPHLYVLAHTLMKRRLFKWEGTEKGEDGVPRILFRNLATDEVYKIEEIDIADEGLVAVMREIECALAGSGLTASPSAPAAQDADSGQDRRDDS